MKRPREPSGSDSESDGPIDVGREGELEVRRLGCGARGGELAGKPPDGLASAGRILGRRRCGATVKRTNIQDPARSPPFRAVDASWRQQSTSRV